MVLLCSDFSTVFYRIIFFSHWKQGVVALSALVAPFELSVRRIRVLPVTAGFIGLMTLVFSADLTYLHYILLWYVHHWNLYDIFLLYTCFIMLGQFLYRIIIVSFFFLLKVGDRRLDSFVAADGIVSCHDDNLPCHWWWQTSHSFDLGARNRALSALFIC